MKRFLSFVLALVLMLGLVPYVSAESIDAETDALLEPSATAAHSRAIVIIPGILGSSLYNSENGRWAWYNELNILNMEDLYLSESGTSLKTITTRSELYGAFSTYKTLYDRLYAAFSNDFDIKFFSYDWRMNNSTAAAQLASFVSGYSEIVLVAHSMGGLVAAKFLDNSSSNRAKTAALISIGTPYVGAAKCIDTMETGELIVREIVGTDVTIAPNIVQRICMNSYAAYQLLPTTQYYAITGIYPVNSGGANYTHCGVLAYTPWGVKSDGSVKPMFNAAESFHSSLYSGSTYILDSCNVPVYTLAGTSLTTISKATLNNGHVITSLSYSNSGDGTVLAKSAGYGNPDYVYSGIEHTELVSHNPVITRVIALITAETGITTANNAAELMNIDAINNTELNPENLIMNARGWIMGGDNRRINVITDTDAQITCNNTPIEIIGEYIYDCDGNHIGHAWNLGNTGRMQYVFNIENYTITCTGNVRIEYMNSGYYDQIVEYALGNEAAVISMPDYTSLPSCYKGEVLITPTVVATAAEIDLLNHD